MVYTNGNTVENGDVSSQEEPLLIDPRTRFSDMELSLPPPDFPNLQIEFETKPDSGEKTYKGSNRLKNRRALITGGDSGIGRAIVIAMAREGAKVAINYLPKEELDAIDLAKFLAKEGIRIHRFPGNLLDEKFCKELIEKAKKALGGLDILVNNAGKTTLQNDDITTYTTEQWDDVIRTNLYTGFWLARAAIPHMPPGSAIVWTVSDVEFYPVQGNHHYAASKGAVASLVRTLGISLASKGILINGVAPGMIYTPLLASAGATTEQLNLFQKTLALGRVGQPAEMAPVYVDLADPLKTYTSGAIWQSSGGTVSYNLGPIQPDA